jgi:hypothetical protein
MATMHEQWREPATVTERQDACMGNAAQGWGRRHQSIKDDGIERRDPGDKNLDIIIGLAE